MNRKLSFATRCFLIFYNALFPFALVFMLPGILLRMFRRGNYREKFAQRFGLYSREVREWFASAQCSGGLVWIQSVSVGETMIALKLAKQMKALAPELRVAISVTTSTGFALGRKSESDWLEVIYNPLDFAPIVRRSLTAIRPRQLILIEGIWPQLLASAHRIGCPVSLVARLSPRSEARFRRFRAISAPLFSLFNHVCVQEPEDVARWESLGVSEVVSEKNGGEKICVTGNIKFDQEISAGTRDDEFFRILASLGVSPNAPILLGGSTFPGEENILANAHLALKKSFPNLFLILVPRHVERTLEIEKELAALGVSAARRSQINPEHPQQNSSDCLLVDTTGELRDWYRMATAVFIGKSLTTAAIGGQNPVEAALAQKPVLFGLHMENFQAIVNRWLADRAAIQVANSEELREQIQLLLANPDRRAELVARTSKALAPHHGATLRTAEIFLNDFRACKKATT